MRYSASLAEEVAGVLAATVPLGMPSGKVGHHPGWKPLQGSVTTMSQAGFQACADSPDPSEGTCKSLRRGFTATTATSTPLELQMCVCAGQSVWGKSSQAGLLCFILAQAGLLCSL